MTLGVITLIIVIAVIFFLCISFYITVFGGGPFVPTPKKAVLKVLKLAKIKKGEILYDIGAGDGRFVHFATKIYKAKATGFELDPFVYFLAKIRQWFFGWEGKIIRGNFLKHNISDADIITCYLLPSSLRKFQKHFEKNLKKGTRILSYAFHIGSLKPKKIVKREKGISQIFIYKIK